MRRHRLVLGCLAAFVAAAMLRADDVTSLKAEVADLKARIASMESLQAGGCDSCGSYDGCGECGICDGVENLTSMKKKACIKIGGDAEIPVLVVHRDDDPLGPMGENDEIDSTTFTGEASLKFRAYANKDIYLHIKLDLEDDGEQMEEAYFMWKRICGTNLSVALGKKEVEFGQDKTIGYMDGFVHGGADLLDWGEAYVDPNNAHGTVGTNSLPGELDNTYVIEGAYAFQDVATLYLSLFQDKRSRGMFEDRADDHLGFQSGAVKLELNPFEGLELELSAINRHHDSYEDAAGRDDDATAVSVGFEYELAVMPIQIFGEYLHGWDWSWRDDMDTDTVQLGVVWGVTECIDLAVMGEWANIDDGARGYDEEDYWDVYLTAYYNFDNGIYMGVEYMHQWFDGDLPASGDHDAEADMVGFVTGWSF